MMILAGDITSALTSFAGLGLALILEGDGAKRVRLGWTDEAAPRLEVSAEGYDATAIAAAVHRHASGCAEEASWVQADLEGPPWDGGSAVFSPRIKAASVPEQWRALQHQRHEGIDREISMPEAIDLIGALGEPAYWRFADRSMKKPRPDEGSSRWEMKTRNRGEDFVANRLRHLAGIVSTRTPEGVGAGLTGQRTIDEAYKGKRSDESRTATGLTWPRFTDSALAWCALWGISAFPVIHRLRQPSVTAGAVPVGEFTPKRLVLPVLVGRFSLGRWRALLVSQQLVVAGDPQERSARAWLASHGARAVLQFPFQVSDNSSAPERYLRAGRIEVLA
ncbi:hypothetical protein [Actinomyces sp. zg296]|uniref:hypothetical protein n=1 Tax=Actinomyces sp. zg296 TaxID=2609289 RepID=UPI001356C729|nr:hypothetical protein [Actinomyces sp. zg296]